MARPTARTLWRRIKPDEIPSTLRIPEPCLELVGWRGVTADLGCGHGRFRREAVQRGSTFYVGVDINESVVQSARALARSEPVAFAVGDVTRLPLPNGGVDTAVLKALLNGLDEPDRAAALAEAQRALRTGGFAVVSDILATSAGLYRDRYKEGCRAGLGENSFGVPSLDNGTLYYSHHFEQDELVQLVAGAGLEIVRTEVSDASSRTGNPIRQLTVVARKR